MKPNPIVCRLLAAWLLVLVAANAVYAQSSLPLFAEDSVLDVVIEGPIDTMLRERSNEDYYDGTFQYKDSAGEAHKLDLKFRTRGNYRRQKSICRFPPVRLNFVKKQVAGTLFDGQNILKLVTHCRPRSGRYEEYVLREQLAYRFFNLVTPASFRSRLLRITWVDTDRDNERDERYGFLIEHKNELEARLGMQQPDDNRIRYSALNPQQAALAAVFEYMIGNTDFSMVKAVEGEACCHNGILLGKAGGDNYFVPYDFDMSGLVNAPYAEPNPRFRLRGVTSRLYRGHCRFNDELDDALAAYVEARDAVYEAIATQPGLKKRARGRVSRFIDGFYADIGSDSRVQKKLHERCVGDSD